MAVGTKQDDETKSGYDSDSLNPGNDWATKVAQDIRGLETAPSDTEDRNIRTAENKFKDDDNTSDQDSARDGEQNPGAIPTTTSLGQSGGQQGGGRFWSKFVKGFKKNGASMGIASLLIGGFSLTSIFMMPAAILVNLEKALHNDGSDSTRMNVIMRRAYMGGILSKGSCTKDLCKKVTSMSEDQKKRWEKQGFTMDSVDEGNGRHKITRITTPDKQVIDTPEKWIAWSENTVDGRRHSDRVLNVRSAFYQNAKFEKVLKKFNLDKAKRLENSTDRDKAERTKKINQSFDSNTGATLDNEQRKTKIKDRMNSKTSEPAGKVKSNLLKKGVNPGSTVIAAACAAYDVTRIASATAKAIWISDLIAFGFPFIQAGAQLESQGSIDPEVVENISDRLTWYDTNKTLTEDDPFSGLKAGDPNPAYNKSAMDAPGVQMAIFGDFEGLDAIAKQYTTAAIQGKLVGAADEIINDIQDNFPGGKQGIRSTCLAGSLAGLATSASCLSGGPFTVVACVAGQATVIIAAAYFGDDIIAKAVEIMIKPTIDFIANANLTSELKGYKAGQALSAGVSLMMAYGSLGSGMKPAASVAAVNSFITKTDEPLDNYTTQIARDEAKENPFDTSNRYSFTGQIASAFNPYRSGDGTVFSQLLNGFAVITSPLSTFSSANALYSQPSNMTTLPNSASNRLNKAVDRDMQDIGAVNDWSGRMVGVVSDEVINRAQAQATGSMDMIGDVIDYMLTFDDGQINEDGSVKGGSQYEKWKKYCTEDRVDPLGTTTQSIMGDAGLLTSITGADPDAEENEAYAIGDRCVDKDNKFKEMIDNFSIYYNICEVQYPTAESSVGGTEVSDCSQVQTVANVTSSGGDWVIPTTGICSSPYGQRWGTLHAGIDIAAPIGTPMVAPTDMKIIYAKSSGDGYGTSITARATDGTSYMFRFGHMSSTSVSAGQSVAKGSPIGSVGNTGNSTGPHLHFEIFDPSSPDGAYRSNGKPVDPVPVLAEHGVTISC